MVSIGFQDENYAKPPWRLIQTAGPALTTADIGTHSEHLIKRQLVLFPSE